MPWPVTQLCPRRQPSLPSEASVVWQSDCSKENACTIFTLLLRILVSSPLLMDQSRMPLRGTQGLFQAGLSLPFQLYLQHSRLQQSSGSGRVPWPHYVFMPVATVT